MTVEGEKKRPGTAEPKGTDKDKAPQGQKVKTTFVAVPSIAQLKRKRQEDLKKKNKYRKLDDQSTI